MAVPYQALLHSVMLRMNALKGSQAGPLETTYTTATLTSTNAKSADFPFSSFRDAILMAVGDFVGAIADTGNHPERSYFESSTAALASGAVLPITDAGGISKILGVYGTVTDSISGIPLTEQPLEVVRRTIQETWRVYPLYFYKIDGGRIFHTRTSVVIRVCVYQRGIELAVWNAGGNMPLADHHESGVVARAISLMTRDNAYADQAGVYRRYSEEALAAIRGGLTSVPGKSLPSPTQVSTAA